MLSLKYRRPETQKEIRKKSRRQELMQFQTGITSAALNIRVFSNESVLRIRWPKYWSFGISLCSEYSGLICFTSWATREAQEYWSECKWKSLRHVWLFCDPMDYTVHETLQARTLEWVAIPFSRGNLPTQGLNPGLPQSNAQNSPIQDSMVCELRT